MTLSAFTLMFEAVFAVVLLVTIVYAVKLNTRISGLRERDSELREMIEQFNVASIQAGDAAAALKSAGVDADRQLRASIDRAQALNDEMAFMIEHGDRIADRIERAAIQQRSDPGRAGGDEPAGPARGSAEAATAAGGGDADEDRRYRSEIEQELARVVRSTATAG